MVIIAYSDLSIIIITFTASCIADFDNFVAFTFAVNFITDSFTIAFAFNFTFHIIVFVMVVILLDFEAVISSFRAFDHNSCLLMVIFLKSLG